MAAINSAYIVSSHFLESLTKRINAHFSELKKQFEAVEEIQTNNQQKLINETETNDPKIKAAIKDLNKSNSKIRAKVEAFSKGIEEHISSNSLSNYFNYLCLYSALYCILILLLIGFEFDFKLSYDRESFFLFNIISICILTWLFKDKKRSKYKASYNKILVVFILSVIISFPILSFIEGFFPQMSCLYDYSLLNVWISLIVPTSHFIYYFFKSSYNSKRKSKELALEMNGIKVECETFANTIETTFSTIKRYVIDEDEGEADKS